MAKKYVYFFGAGAAEGNMKMKDVLGGKGANLAEMAGIGLPVPPGFTVSTEVCALYYKNRKKIPEAVRLEVEKNLKKLEKSRRAGVRRPQEPAPRLRPLRRPGLHAGHDGHHPQPRPQRQDGRRPRRQDRQRALRLRLLPPLRPDVRRRRPRASSRSTRTTSIPSKSSSRQKKHERGIKSDTDLTAADLKDLVARFKAAIKEKTGHDFPDDPTKQLWGAIGAVFGSWMNDRAIAYRKMYDIPEAWGTAVNVQLMVFGNMGNDSGTGVAFTRDAATGENVFYGEYLMNAQGEDVVAGIRTPKPIAELKKDDPKAYAELEKIRHTLEKHYTDMMDIEFTIQQGKLYMLQCRVGKRTAFAAIKIAVDMVDEKLISEKEALSRIEPDQLNQLLRPIFDPAEKQAAIKAGRLLAKGLNAGPGAATGRVVFNSVDAEAWAKRGEKVILTRIETSPEDIKGMNAAEGILTARGGMTSHAALVARQMGRVCVAGCGELLIDYGDHTMTVKGRALKEGDWISIDGTTGEVIEGRINTKPSEVLQVLIEKTLDPAKAPVYRTFAKVMAWADKYRTLKIRTNADQPDQSAQRRGLRGRGHRPLPDRAHVLRRGQDRPDARDDPGRHARAAEGRPGQAPAAPAPGLRRHLRGHGRTARDHPDDRSAAPRVPAPRGEGPARDRRRRWASPTRRSRSASSPSTSSIPCSASAAAAWASSTPRSPRCRPGPSSRPPRPRRRRRSRSCPRS